MNQRRLAMNKIAMFFSVMAAAMLLSALPAFSGGTGPYGAFGRYGMEPGVESRQIANKDECLLVARNCPPDMAYVQNRIDRLNREIAKGTDVYTPAELRVLNDKLNAAYEELNRTNSGY
jgi:hypothetical protein